MDSLDTKHAHLLTEIGYAASMLGHGKAVAPVFDLLMVALPDNAAGAIGKAINAINQNDCQQAIDVLEQHGIGKNVSSDEAQAIHLLALFMGGHKDRAREIADNYTESDGICYSMAQSLFEA